MRSKLRILIAAAAGLLVVPQLAMADDVEEQLRLMNERMAQLENQLQATQDELDASKEQVDRQQDVIQKAGIEGQQGASGLSGFFQKVEISGWLAASWWWNFNNPQDEILRDQEETADGSSVNGGYSAYVAPFHPDHNSFSVDQLWFEIEKPVTEESRGGFRADIVFGKTASLLNRNNDSNYRACSIEVSASSDFDDECVGNSASDLDVFQAYVQYLTPWGDATVKAGKFATWIGYEVPGTVNNFNITRGIVWTLLQPVNHYGVSVDGQTDGGITYGIGVANSILGVDPDFNNAKAVMGKLGYAGETFSTQAAVMWSPENVGRGNGDLGILDLIVTWDPMESLSTWVNFTYAWAPRQSGVFLGDPQHGFELGSGTTYGWGVAAAGRYAITDRLGLALRGEFAQDNNNFFGFFNDRVFPFGATDADLYAFTLTADYALTDNLMVRWEGRYDRADFQNTDTEEFVKGTSNCSGGFFSQDCFTKQQQFLTGLEVVYQF